MKNAEPLTDAGDFSTTPRTLFIAGLAIGIGFLTTFLALGLLKLIALFTNLFYFQRLSGASASPADHHLGILAVLVPVLGSLIVGLMARYGSERIRGHGIPEAIEAILIRGSRVEPRVALLKPVSAAISIGSGGPFGAEGPIIMTGGAFGSLLAQFLHLTAAERKILLVAGAAAGMSATFGTPVAAALLAVELLLFEWKPRSFVPVALASAMAAAARHAFLAAGPLFPAPPHPDFVGPVGLLACAAAGLLAGGLSIGLTKSVYASEDLFQRLPFHWMWWPALGGLVIGLGGLVCPRALGVGYDVISDLMNVPTAGRVVFVLLLVKGTIWALSLGSGTSGGVLAPLLIMGGALGGLESAWFPDEGTGFWPLVSMAAVLAGTMRSPFTAMLFAVELTHDLNLLLPLLIAAAVAHAVTVLVLRRSILTEKLSRRGFHVSREYAVDPLEILMVKEVMDTAPSVLPVHVTARELASSLAEGGLRKGQRLYPVIDGTGNLAGVVTRSDMERWAKETAHSSSPQTLWEIVHRDPVTAFPDETLREVIYRMSRSGRTRLPVVERGSTRRLLGKISLRDMLKARARHLEEEERRERILPFKAVLPAWLRPKASRP